ncbi:MAG: hypothetical protein HY815_24465 [Candidatus Riflebacteria bacterium]|nr:hypothetical protein [Candidatus Riflebacteria bacterium]
MNSPCSAKQVRLHWLPELLSSIQPVEVALSFGSAQHLEDIPAQGPLQRNHLQLMTGSLLMQSLDPPVFPQFQALRFFMEHESDKITVERNIFERRGDEGFAAIDQYWDSLQL